MNASDEHEVEVTTWHLEMLAPDALRPAAPPTGEFAVRQAQIPCAEFGRFLYTTVGNAWHWIDRLSWSPEQWFQRLSGPGVEIWVGYFSGTPAGYFELEMDDDGDVEIAYFGLLPQFIGQGLGGALLTAAVDRSWRRGARRVWVHTCSLDGPHALANYEARGFRAFKVEKHHQKLVPPG